MKPELRSIDSFRGGLGTASPPNDGIKTCLVTLTDVEAHFEQWVSGFVRNDNTKEEST